MRYLSGRRQHKVLQMAELTMESARVSMFLAMHRTAAALGFGIASFRQPERREGFSRVKAVKAKRRMLMTPLEAAQLMYSVTATAKLGGAMAEIGVYQGASARLIRETDRAGRPLHLFDTFTGLPQTSERDTEFGRQPFQQGEFACSLEDVQGFLRDLDGIAYHPGLFPYTGGPVSHLRFSFVHLDVDLYDSSRQSLAWLYPRLLPGAIVLSHDFASCAGPRAALTEFFADKPEPLIELTGNQAMVVKL